MLLNPPGLAWNQHLSQMTTETDLEFLTGPSTTLNHARENNHPEIASVTTDNSLQLNDHSHAGTKGLCTLGL